MESDGPHLPTALPSLKLRHGTYIFYWLAFGAITVMTVLGLFFGDMGEALVGLPMILVLGMALFVDRKSIHVPPAMVVLVVSAFFVAFAGRSINGDNALLTTVAGILTGINLGLLGLILIYILLRSMPGIRDEDRRVVGFISISIALASYAMIRIVQYIAQVVILDRELGYDIDQLVVEMCLILIGSFIVALIYGFERRENIFGGIINSFLEDNSEIIGMDDMQRSDILKLIEEGESGWLEFKSTLRTNLQTGETDKRMEKAVLKDGWDGEWFRRAYDAFGARVPQLRWREPPNRSGRRRRDHRSGCRILRQQGQDGTPPEQPHRFPDRIRVPAVHLLLHGRFR